MKSWWAMALDKVFGSLSAEIVLLANQQPHGIAIALLLPLTLNPIQAHDSNEVKKPGVYSLASESRVQTAIQADNVSNPIPVIHPV